MNQKLGDTRVLAIAPSTRGFGFAVIEGQKLIIWGGKRTKRKGDGNKNRELVEMVDTLIHLWHPAILVTEDVNAKDSRRRLRIRELVPQITALARRSKVKTELLPRSHVKRAFFEEIPFRPRDNTDLVRVIRAIIVLLETDAYKTIINKHLPEDNLRQLLAELETRYREDAEERMKKLWVNLVEKIELASRVKFTIHKLRHTFATLMIEGGCDIYSLSRMMGHSDIKTTTIYLSASSEHLRCRSSNQRCSVSDFISSSESSCLHQFIEIISTCLPIELQNAILSVLSRIWTPWTSLKYDLWGY